MIPGEVLSRKAIPAEGIMAVIIRDMGDIWSKTRLAGYAAGEVNWGAGENFPGAPFSNVFKKSIIYGKYQRKGFPFSISV